MELRLTAEQEAKLNALAQRTRRDTNERLSEAVDYLVEYNEWFDRKITASLEDVEANGAVPDEDIAVGLESRKRH
jgi:predicted transcriptional regulator